MSAAPDTWLEQHDADPAARAGAILTVDLDAVARNWRDLARRARPALCAAVVKADAYGLGAEPVARALWRAGCREFFVAHLDEGVALRATLGADCTIYVLHGPPPGTEGAFVRYRLLPALNSEEQCAGWARQARQRGTRLPAALQLDTGMARLGLAESELERIDDAPDLRLVMSHLACADEPGHPANARQLARFRRLRGRWPGVPASLAASSGIFLGAEYHCDMVRPGAALYGVAPAPGPNPMQPVVSLRARIVQTRALAAGDGVGYGQTWQAPARARIATIAVGYADGFPRALSNRGAAWSGAHRLPFVGRVSMDSITLDVSALPEGALQPGDWVELLGPHVGVDDLAQAGGTIGYEVLTALGRRYHRCHIGG